MYKLFSFIFFLFGLYLPVNATVIRGENPEYAGKTLIFYSYSDPITKGDVSQFSIEFDSFGKFSTQINFDQTTFVYCDFGVYHGMFFAEPEKTIELLFPPFREKSFANQKNPFFEPVPFWFNTKNGILTKQINDFDIRFNQLTNQYFNQLYFRQSKEILDSVLYFLNIEFPVSEYEVFEVHKKLKTQTLETDVFRFKTEDVSEIISEIKPAFWNTPAFIAFFDKVFNSRLSFDVKEMKGSELRNAVGNADLIFLEDYVKQKYKVSGVANKLVLLKLLHDGFYSGEFSKSLILKTINLDFFTKNEYKIIGKISKDIYAKLSLLLPGTKSPVVCLNTLEGNEICTDSTKDKFKYLVFADTEMVVCREHLKHLNKIEERFQKNLEIYIVLRNTNATDIKEFVEENKIAGIKLFDAENKYIKLYRVKSFPVSYLLNEKHEVVFQETKSPIDGFERQFGAYLQKELFQRQRN